MMNVTGIISNFREALVSLVPAFDAVKIPWRQDEAYDEWGSVASALYDSLVSEVIRWELPESLHNEFSLPPYDIIVPDLKTCSWIVVLPHYIRGVRVFHSFSSSEGPFDLVRFRLVSENGTPISSQLETMSLSTAEFGLQLKDPSEESSGTSASERA